MTVDKLIENYEKELQEFYDKYETDNLFTINHVADRTLALAILDFTNQLRKIKRFRVKK